MPRVIDVILNAGSGSTADDTSAQIVDLCRARDIEARLHELKEGVDGEALVEKAAAEDGEILIACGGDGTVSLVAGAAVKAKKTIGVLPLGTLNNFSKDIEIPQVLEEAIDIIAAGHTSYVDIAEVNGQTFINNSSIGLYPRIVHDREKQQRLGRGKWFAAFWAALKVLRFSHFLRVKLLVNGKEFIGKTPFVFVGNNDYDMDLYNIGRRPRLDDGKLSVYFLRRGGRWGVIMMLVKTMIGSLSQWSDFEHIETEEITIISRKKVLPVAFDGEVQAMPTPLTYRIHPRALTVITPAPKTEE